MRSPVVENLTRRGRGRPKGSANKVSAAAKDVIAAAAEELGGQKRIVAWAKEDTQNERAFWSTIYPKLLPLQVGGQIDSDITVHAGSLPPALEFLARHSAEGEG